MASHMLKFVPFHARRVAAGRKDQTIRPLQRSATRVGDLLHLWEGTRHTAVRKLGVGRVIKVGRITVPDDARGPSFQGEGAAALARREGFRDWPEMRAFIRQMHGLPFTGLLIRWERVQEGDAAPRAGAAQGGRPPGRKPALKKHRSRRPPRPR